MSGMLWRTDSRPSQHQAIYIYPDMQNTRDALPLSAINLRSPIVCIRFEQTQHELVCLCLFLSPFFKDIPDQCSPSPCNARGTVRCEDKKGDFLCHCFTGWAGARCDKGTVLAMTEGLCFNAGHLHRHSVSHPSLWPRLWQPTAVSCTVRNAFPSSLMIGLSLRNVFIVCHRDNDVVNVVVLVFYPPKCFVIVQLLLLFFHMRHKYPTVAGASISDVWIWTPSCNLLVSVEVEASHYA